MAMESLLVLMANKNKGCGSKEKELNGFINKLSRMDIHIINIIFTY